MLDRLQRDKLFETLLLLVDGVVTNDEFDTLYYGGWVNSKDRAVAAIAEFGWSLYSSGTIVPTTVNVSSEARQGADRALRFLKCDLEYEWPELPKGTVPYFCWWSPGLHAAIGLAFLGVASPIAYGVVTFAGVLVLLVASLHLHSIGPLAFDSPQPH